MVDLDTVHGTGDGNYGYGIEEQLLQEAIAALPLPTLSAG